MRRPLGLSIVFVVLVSIAPSLPARADIIIPDPPESKRVPLTIELDWGVFTDRVSKKHVIAAGETLRAIATKALGNASHAKAIVAANSEVIADADKIRVGDVVWLPPQKSLEAAAKPSAAPAATAPAEEPAVPALSPWYDAFWFENTGYRGRGPPVLKARATPGEPAQSTLVLVPHAASAALTLAIASGPVPVKLEDLKGALTLGMWADTLVHRDDPTVRIVTTYKLTGASSASLTTEIARVRYDAEGKTVTKEWAVPQPGFGRGSRGEAEKPPSSPAAPAEAAMATPLPVTPGGAEAPPPETPPLSDDGSHWPASTGVLVAAVGAAIVAGLWVYKRSRAAAPPPPPPPTA